MFICKLCDESLSSVQKILGTYCGHIFHKKCLDRHLLRRSHHCPSCQKSLRVDLTSASSGYAVLPLYPEERKEDVELSPENGASPTSKKKDPLQENAMLKQKLVEVIQGLIVMQKELKFNSTSHSSLIPERDIPNSSPIAFTGKERCQKGESPSYHNKTSNKSITDMIIGNILQSPDDMNDADNYEGPDNEQNETADDYTDVNNATLMSPELVILQDKSMIGKGLSEEEKNRIIRSKRREYLTWRNKAQSWLTKMEDASIRLLRLESSFTQEEYLEQLRLFFNKVYNQGGIIDEAKQAASVYLIIDDVPEADMREIHGKVYSLTETHSAIMTVLLNKINFLKAERSNFDEGLQLENTSAERNSSIGTESEDGGDDDDRHTVIERKVSLRPHGKVVMRISGLSDTVTCKEPVFV